jgi:hypothetical protein
MMRGGRVGTALRTRKRLLVGDLRRFFESGSSGWTRTSNPPVNRLMQVLYPAVPS